MTIFTVHSYYLATLTLNLMMGGKEYCQLVCLVSDLLQEMGGVISVNTNHMISRSIKLHWITLFTLMVKVVR